MIVEVDGKDFFLIFFVCLFVCILVLISCVMVMTCTESTFMEEFNHGPHIS